MQDRKLNFALIGCGRISHKHLNVLSQLPDGKLVAVADVIAERAKACASAYKVDWYTDYHKMLTRDDIDVVNILTPSGSHAQIGVDAAKYKKHLVIEKPMALRLEDADDLIKTCQDNNVRLFVVKQNRYNLPVQKLKETIDSGRFGKLVMGTVRVRWCRRQEYYNMDPWRGTWKMDGGVLANQASHHIDLLQWLLGPVESVVSKTATRLVDIEAEDTGVAILKFKNGALGLIEATTCTRPKDLEGSVSILGERGTVEIGGFAVSQMKTWHFEDKLPGDDETLGQYSQNPPDVYGFGHIEFLKEVIRCLKNNQRHLVDGIEGRKSLELINAIYESSESGKEIFLGQRNSSFRCKLGR